MKKISVIFLSLIAIVLVTGCEDKEQMLVCTTTHNEDGLVIEEVISMTFKNDKLKHMTMEVNTKIDDIDTQNNWEMFKQEMDKNNEEFSKDGVSLKVEKNDKNFEYNVSLDIDVENASEEVLKEQGFEGLKDDNSTLQDNKERAEKDGAICEIK